MALALAECTPTQAPWGGQGCGVSGAAAGGCGALARRTRRQLAAASALAAHASMHRQRTWPDRRSCSSVWAYFRLGSEDTLSSASAGRCSSRPVMGPVFGTWITVAAAAPAAGAAPAAAVAPSATSPRKRL